MNPLVLLGIVAVVFGVAPILLRSNTVYMLLALCLGEILAKLEAQDVTQIVNSIVALNIPVYSYVQIFLLVIAPVILLFTFKKGVKSSKMVLQIVPAIAGVLLAFMLIVTKLPYDMQKTMQNSNLYLTLKPYYGLAAAAGLLFSMFYLWTRRPRPDKLEKKHKK